LNSFFFCSHINADVEIADDNFLLDVPYALDTAKQAQPTFSSFFPQSKRADAESEEAPNWSIFVYTSKLANAGTDSNVHLQIFGSLVASERLHLSAKADAKRLFEPGSCDRFDRKLAYIGKPAKIKIGHDNKGLAPGWHLDKVVLHDLITDAKFLFKCERWLAKDEADGQLEAEFALAGGGQKHKSESNSSSWNSSEDEDSLSFGGGAKAVTRQAKASLVQAPNPNLNQIDELNETNASKATNNFQTNESFMRKLETSIQFGGQQQQASDFGESEEEGGRVDRRANRSQLEESFELEKRPTLGQMFLKSGGLQEKKKRVSYGSPRDDESKSQSIGSFLNQLDEAVKPVRQGRASGLNLIVSEILGVAVPASGLEKIAGEIVEADGGLSPRSNTFSVGSSTSGKARPKKGGKMAGLKQASRNANNRSRDRVDASDWSESERSESIGDLKRAVDEILEPAARQGVQGLSSLLREEFKNNDNFFVGSLREQTATEGLGSLVKKEKERRDRPPSISSFDTSEISGRTPEPFAREVEGLSSLVHKEFTNHKNEFFVSSLNDQKQTEVEGLSSLVKKEFTNHKNEFFASTLNEPKQGEVEGLSSLVKKEFTNHKKEFFVSSLNDQKQPEVEGLSSLVNKEKGSCSSSVKSPVSIEETSRISGGLGSIISEALSHQERPNQVQREEVESLSSLVKKEFTNHKNEFFVSSLNDQKQPEVEGLSSLVQKEFTSHQNEFFVSSLSGKEKGSRSSSVKSPVSMEEASRKSGGLGSIMGEALNHLEKAQRPQISLNQNQLHEEEVESLSSLVKKEFTNHKNEFFVSSLNDQKQTEVEGLSSLVKKEFTNHKNEFFASTLNEPKQGEVEGLSSLVKKEFTNHKNEFFASALNEPKQFESEFFEKSETSGKSSVKSPDARQPQFLSAPNNNNNNDISIHSLRSDDGAATTPRPRAAKKTLGSQQRPNLGGIYFDSDTESSSFSEEVFSQKPQPSSAHKPGSIGAAIGSIVGAGHSSSSANNSLVSVTSQRKPPATNSFANLVPELFEVSNLNESVSSQQLGQSILLKTRQDELEQVRQLLQEVRAKNAALSGEKHACEVRLREVEASRRGLETVCGERERELEAKERQIEELSGARAVEMGLKRQLEQLRGENEALAARLAAGDSQQRLINTSSFINSSEEFGLIAARLPPAAVPAAEVRVKALEAQIEEQNVDRGRLSASNAELSARLDTCEDQVRMQNEALQIATYQFNIEKNLLVEENERARFELQECGEAKARLEADIEIVGCLYSRCFIFFINFNLNNIYL
jgi:hypothetical protein